MVAKNPYSINLTIEKLTQQSYARLFLIWLSMAFLFGLLYFLLFILSPANSPHPIDPKSSLGSKFFNSLYYSIITATSTGYGDIVPSGFSKLLASAQSFIALVVFAIFVTKLVSYKQELALREMHKLMFEDVFHNVREGLYVVRKDCDRFIRHVKNNHTITTEDWDDLTISYLHAQSLLQKIPQFYGENESQTGFYTIDRNREVLLHDAAQRTLMKIEQMNTIFLKAKVPWLEQESVVKQLRRTVELVDTILLDWGKESPHKRDFADILEINEAIKAQISS